MVNGKHGFELDRNEDSQLKVPRKSDRSRSNALNPEAYLEFLEQMVVVCKDEGLRDEILQLINGRILSIKDYIITMCIPRARLRNYCYCFEDVFFDNDELLFARGGEMSLSEFFIFLALGGELSLSPCTFILFLFLGGDASLSLGALGDL